MSSSSASSFFTLRPNLGESSIPLPHLMSVEQASSFEGVEIAIVR